MPRNPGTFASVTGTAQLFASATAPQYLYGDAIQTKSVAHGSLMALVTAVASTSTLSITANWQVSTDGTTYYDCVAMNSQANVALITGTGTSATVNKAIDAPNVTGWRYARIKAANTGANADAATDGVTVSYKYSRV
jgi:hypothetical protein